MSLVQLLEWNQALKFYHGQAQRHSLELAKKESLDLVHRIVFANHCSIHLLPWKQLKSILHSRQDSCGITPVRACVYSLNVFLRECTPWTCVSSFALYSWFLMASSTPYPDRNTFFSLGFWRKKGKFVNNKAGGSVYLMKPHLHWQQTVSIDLWGSINSHLVLSPVYKPSDDNQLSTAWPHILEIKSKRCSLLRWA